MKSKTTVRIREATLLSLEEYQRNRPLINNRDINSTCFWALRTICRDENYCVYRVNFDGSTGYIYFGVGVSVRPALVLEENKLPVCSKIEYAGESFTVLYDDLALCDRCLDYICFWNNYRVHYIEDLSEIYEESDVKKWIDDWFSKNGIFAEVHVPQEYEIACPNCGAARILNLKDMRKHQFCSLCGTPFQYAREEGYSSFLAKQGVMFLESSEFCSAYRIFEEMSKSYPQDCIGWIGTVVCKRYAHRSAEKEIEKVKETAPKSIIGRLGEFPCRDIEDEKLLRDKLLKLQNRQKVIQDQMNSNRKALRKTIKDELTRELNETRTFYKTEFENARADYLRVKAEFQSLKRKYNASRFWSTVGALLFGAIVSAAVTFVLTKLFPMIDKGKLPLLVVLFLLVSVIALVDAYLSRKKRKHEHGTVECLYERCKSECEKVDIRYMRCYKNCRQFSKANTRKTMNMKIKTQMDSRKEELKWRLDRVQERIDAIQKAIDLNHSGETLDYYLQVLRSIL